MLRRRAAVLGEPGAGAVVGVLRMVARQHHAGGILLRLLEATGIGRIALGARAVDAGAGRPKKERG